MTGCVKAWLAAISMLLVSEWSEALPSEVLIAQPPVSLSPGTSGTWNTAWEGVPGRTYLMQWSDDLVNWNYFPLTAAGAGTKAYGFASSTDNFFLRLATSDETPDLAKSTEWKAPLLLVGGPWKVMTKVRSGAPAAGIGLAFYRWPAGASQPQTVPVLRASTGPGGDYNFNPAALEPDDRVEVRMTGSPGQRVYLPWAEGSEASDTNIAAGGSGTGLSGLLTGSHQGTDAEPDYTIQPGGNTDPPEPENMRVFRFVDFLTSYYSNWNFEEDWYPTGDHMTTRETFDGLSTVVDSESTPKDTARWNTRFQLGKGFHLGVPLEATGDPYEADLSVNFGDPSLEIPVRRNIFVGTHFGQDAYRYVPNVSYPPEDVIFKDGEVCDVGAHLFPYTLAEYTGAQITYEYYRYLILGPVPMYVPKSVMGGQPFFYDNLETINLNAELPLGFQLHSSFRDATTSDFRPAWSKIRWTATVQGLAGCEVRIFDGQGPETEFGKVAVRESNDVNVTLLFQPAQPSEIPFDENFSVTLKAEAMIATTEHPPTGGSSEYTYDYAYHDLGSFTTHFEYSETPDGSTPDKVAKRQVAELWGLCKNHGIPEGDGFNGGQRSRTLESERRIGVDGRPAPSSPTFVDALTGRFHHTETDFSLAIPGSDLSLTVGRSVAETVWTKAFGLEPEENPLLAFGPGWDSTLTGSLTRTSDLLPNGTDRVASAENSRMLKSNISVRDYQGRTYRFMEYSNETGSVSYLPDPTLLPERTNAGISLTAGAGGSLVLTQPLLGMTHVYQPGSLDLRIANNRNTPQTHDGANPTGFTRHQYYRLASVTDRFGVKLAYSYGADAAKLVPDVISVVGRPSLQLRIQQSGGRVQAFWDPAGIKHTYQYESRDLAGNGQSIHPVLASHQTGTIMGASYGYQHAVEADPRPPSMLLKATGGSDYTISTYHIVPATITNGTANAITVLRRLSDVRSAWSASAADYYHPAGDPMIVTSITLPNQTTAVFDAQHALKYGRPGKPAQGGNPAVAEIPSDLSIITAVTDISGAHWTWNFTAPSIFAWTLPVADDPFLPSASALVFPRLTRSCAEVPGSSMTFEYDPEAGFALRRKEDAAERTTAATHTESFPASSVLYHAPHVSTTAGIGSYFNLPSTTTDTLNHKTTYQYVSSPGQPSDRLPETITDFRGRVIATERGAHSRTESLKTFSAAGGVLLSEIDFGYESTLPGVVTKITRKAIPGAADPAWVSDLVTNILPDANGFPSRVGSDAANLHTTTTRSPAGRVLAVESPDGGTRSRIYDAAGLLAAAYAQDGSHRSYRHDPAGRTVVVTDELGHSTGFQYDSMGRISSAIRDMNGNLDCNTSGVLSGIDVGTDIVSSASYLDATREIRFTDPRGYISIRRSEPLGRPVRNIAPGNNAAPGTIPTEATGRVTSFDYDLLQVGSPGTELEFAL